MCNQLINNEIKPNVAIFVILSLFFGMAIAVYSRFFLHDATIWATDEGNYLEIITILQNEQKFPLSGPLYVWVVEQLQYLLNTSLINALPFYAFITSCILPVCFYLFYYDSSRNLYGLESIKDNNTLFSFVCVLMLFSSSYFIWPLIEGRPQQFGSFMMLVALYLFYRQLLNGSFFQLLSLLLLSTVLFYYHILSFIFFISIASMLCFWLYISKRCSFFNLFLPILMIFVGVYVFTDVEGVYYLMYQDLLNFHLKNFNFQYIGIAISIMILAAFSLQKVIIYVVKQVQTALQVKYIIVLLILLSVIALMIQMSLFGEDVFYFYRNSKIVFVVFQLGNLFFLMAYFFGLYYLNQQKQLNNFFVISSVLFLILAIFSLIISFYLGHKNLLIRLLNFWILVAAPVVGIAFFKFYQFNWAFILVLPIVIILSIILSTKNGLFFNFEGYWDRDDIDAVNWACQHPGNYKITHLERELRYFSKENSYHKLKKILCYKAKLSLHSVPLACNNTVYHKGNVQICYDKK